MNKAVDFRLVKPQRRWNHHKEAIEYEIPCIVLKIGKKLKGNLYSIDIEHIDFVTGEKVKNEGITYAKTIDMFNSLDKKPPFATTCRVVKKRKGEFYFVVYGVFNAGLIEKFYNVKGILNNDENEIMDVFESNYKEFLDWLMEISSNKPNNDYKDLPF